MIFKALQHSHAKHTTTNLHKSQEYLTNSTQTNSKGHHAQVTVISLFNSHHLPPVSSPLTCAVQRNQNSVTWCFSLPIGRILALIQVADLLLLSSEEPNYRKAWVLSTGSQCLWFSVSMFPLYFLPPRLPNLSLCHTSPIFPPIAAVQ